MVIICATQHAVSEETHLVIIDHNWEENSWRFRKQSEILWLCDTYFHWNNRRIELKYNV
jgi:hypothetical protein